MSAKIWALGAVAVLAASPLAMPNAAMAETVKIDASSLPAVGKTDPRYLSYNIDMAAITGAQVWHRPQNASKKAGSAQAKPAKPLLFFAKQPPINLDNHRIRTLAAALGPAYIRASGTTANSVYFQNNDKPAMAPPRGFKAVLTRAEWRGFVKFAQAVDAKILTSFSISAGVRNAAGTWTPVEAAPLIAYTRAIGGKIYAAELFNEPNVPSFGGAPKGYNATQFARDEAAFRAFVAKAAPQMKIVGPGDASVFNLTMPGIPAAKLMAAKPQPKFDIISYHFYPALAERCAPPDSLLGANPKLALTDGWLARPDKSFEVHKAMRDRYAPGAPIWDTETGGAACGGASWDTTFLDSFRFLDMRGRLAKQGLDVLFHQTLVGGNYGLLDDKTYEPRPNYWAAYLWHRMMGPTVLNTGPLHPGLHLYAQCLRDHRGGVSVLAINLQKRRAHLWLSAPADVYALTASPLDSTTVSLNGKPLKLGPSDKLPVLQPRHSGARVNLAPTSIAFIALPKANNPNCQ